MKYSLRYRYLEPNSHICQIPSSYYGEICCKFLSIRFGNRNLFPISYHSIIRCRNDVNGFRNREKSLYYSFFYKHKYLSIKKIVCLLVVLSFNLMNSAVGHFTSIVVFFILIIFVFINV